MAGAGLMLHSPPNRVRAEGQDRMWTLQKLLWLRRIYLHQYAGRPGFSDLGLPLHGWPVEHEVMFHQWYKRLAPNNVLKIGGKGFTEREMETEFHDQFEQDSMGPVCQFGHGMQLRLTAPTEFDAYFRALDGPDFKTISVGYLVMRFWIAMFAADHSMSRPWVWQNMLFMTGRGPMRGMSAWNPQRNFYFANCREVPDVMVTDCQAWFTAYYYISRKSGLPRLPVEVWTRVFDELANFNMYTMAYNGDCTGLPASSMDLPFYAAERTQTEEFRMFKHLSQQWIQTAFEASMVNTKN